MGWLGWSCDFTRGVGLIQHSGLQAQKGHSSPKVIKLIKTFATNPGGCLQLLLGCGPFIEMEKSF